MNFNIKLFAALSLGFFSFNAYGAYPSQAGLFAKLNKAGIGQVVELPYNTSLVSTMSQQVKVYDIHRMDHYSTELPEGKSLGKSFSEASEFYDNKAVLPKLSYRLGKGECNYMEASQVRGILVCYKRAYKNNSVLAPVSQYGPKCLTVRSAVSHCFIFAHRVDEVLRALSK